MFLKNYYNYIAYKNGFQNVNSSCTVTDNKGTARTVNSSSTQMILDYALQCIPTSEGGTGIHFGSGTTEPTFNDYKLESRIDNSNFTALSSVTTIVDEEKITFTSLITLTNISTSALMISEIGLCDRCSSSQYVYIERSLLETPIALEPNEVAQITYTIVWNLKTA